jgi:hypothetical protein
VREEFDPKYTRVVVAIYEDDGFLGPMYVWF